MKNPHVTVGIVSAECISFSLNAPFLCNGKEAMGLQKVTLEGHNINWNGTVYNELCFEPIETSASFTLHDVTIGIDFHWERQENQTFLGCLRIVEHSNQLIAINTLPIDTYLESVISSEMSALSSIELLKAHTIISRSWLLAQIEKRKQLTQTPSTCDAFIQTSDTQIKWYDREDHTLFDVCSDDHCQRYQGITKETTTKVKEAVQATKGQTLMYGDEICDARFSKCCGGVTEEYKYCWEDIDKPYLSSVTDNVKPLMLDLTKEDNFSKWVYANESAFCNTNDVEVLSQVLNDYDQETTNFYRWEVHYTQQEIKSLLKKKLNIDLGNIKDLIPLERGKSGRISKLQIIGEKGHFTIGKELEIRRAFSQSHLYSSAFVVKKQDIENEIPQTITLKGAGWGHGVGLCQIGAAVMAHKGYDYEAILLHYYKGASIQQLYK